MPTPLVSRVVAIMEKHAQEICPSCYTSTEGASERHCLLGWMAKEAGIELPQPQYNAQVIGMAGTLEFAAALQREYGLPLELLKHLQFANDDARDGEELVRLVMGVLWGQLEDEAERRAA